MNTAKIADWLGRMGSHDILMEGVLRGLADAGVEYDESATVLRGDGREVHAPVRTSEDIERIMVERGTGGTLHPGHWLGFSVYEMAEALCTLVAGWNAGGQIHGRGAKFAACLGEIRRIASRGRGPGV